MASAKGLRGGNGEKAALAANRNEEGKRSVTELSRIFNQRREGVAPVPKTPQETKRSSAVVDWMTKGNTSSPAKKPATPVAIRPAIPADPKLVSRLICFLECTGTRRVGQGRALELLRDVTAQSFVVFRRK